MIEIKNLSQLKRAINAGTPFVILKHYIKPEFEGQIRKPSVVQTNGFYSVIHGDPEHPVSKFNEGKGSWLAYGNASGWSFEDGVCKLFDIKKERPVWEIKFVEEA